MKLKSFTQKDRYGNMTSYDFYESDDNMGVPEMQSIPKHPGSPKGTDTVPAWLTPGEFVMNAEATRMFEPQIEQMNNAGRAIQAQQGGTIPQYEANGGPVYLAEGSGGFFDSLLNMFSNKTETKKPLNPLDDPRVQRINQLQNMNKGAPPVPVSAPDIKSMTPTTSNQSYLNLLKDTEGFRNEAYLDSAGIPTIGYGFTKGVKMGDTIDQDTADKRLLEEAAVSEKDYNNLVTVDLNPNQQAAVKSLLYNIGGPQFENSKARAALNAGDFESFKKEAAEFRMANGKVIPGLENRRAKELSLFSLPYETPLLEESVISKVKTPTPPPAKPVIRSLNKFGKTDNYKKVGDEWYRIKDNGQLAKDPASSLQAANLNNQEGSPLVGDPVATQGDIDRANEFASVPDMPKAPPVPPSVVELEDEDIDQDAEQLKAMPEYMRSDKMQGKNRSAGSQYGPKKNYGNVTYDSLGNPQPVNPNRVDPSIPNTLNDRLISGTLSRERYNALMSEYNQAVKQNDAYQDYQKDIRDGTDSETLMLNQEKAIADTKKAIGLETIKEQETDPVVVNAINKKLNDLGKQVVVEDEDIDQGVEQQKVIDSGLQLAGTEDEDLDQSAEADEVLLGMVDPMGENETPPNNAVDMGENPADMEGSVPSMDEPPKPNLKKDYPGGDGSTKNEQDAKNIAKAIVEDDDALPDDGTTDGQTAEDAEKAGAEKGTEEDVGKVEGMMQNIFGNLFDKGELQRMAIMYLGSRIMGGSHNGSMNFAAKQYIERIDAKEAAANKLKERIDLEDRQEKATIRAEDRAVERAKDKETRTLETKLAQEERTLKASADLRKQQWRESLSKAEMATHDAAYKTHSQRVFDSAKTNTKESVKSYRESWDPKAMRGDPTLLIPKTAATTMKQNSEYKSFYDKTPGGKLIKVEAAPFTITDGQGNTRIVLLRRDKKTPINSAQFTDDRSMVPTTQEFKDRQAKNAVGYQKQLEGLMERQLTTNDDGVNDKSSKPTKLDPYSASMDIAEWEIRTGADGPTTRQAAKMAYADAVAYAKANPDVPVENIGKFMDGAYIKATSGRESLFKMGDGNSVNSFEVKDLSKDLLTAARAHGVVKPDQTDASALPSLIRQFGDQFAIGKTYEVDDPATGSKKTITIDEKMMETWATEAKKAKVSPFMRWLSDRLTSDANIKS